MNHRLIVLLDHDLVLVIIAVKAYKQKKRFVFLHGIQLISKIETVSLSWRVSGVDCYHFIDLYISTFFRQHSQNKLMSIKMATLLSFLDSNLSILSVHVIFSRNV